MDTRNVTLPTLNDNSNQTAVVTGLSPFTLLHFPCSSLLIRDRPFFFHLGGLAEDCWTTLEAGEWKDSFMVDYLVCVCVWVGIGWLFFFQPIQYDSSHVKEIKWEKEIIK